MSTLTKPGQGMNSGDNQYFTPSKGSDADFYTGAFNDNDMLYDPLLVGMAVFCWTRFPKWVLQEYPEFKMITQKNFAGFDGLSDLELSTAGVTEGFAQNEYHVAQNMGAKPSTFNLKHLEYSGSYIRNSYTHWVSGIRDPRTGIATYPKQYNMDYKAVNHTAELMYMVLRPDANNKDKNIIEFAAYWTAVMPKKIPLSHFNYTKATQNVPIEIDMPFSGIMHIGPKVDEAAVALMKSGAHGFDWVTQNDFELKNYKSS